MKIFIKYDGTHTFGGHCQCQIWDFFAKNIKNNMLIKLVKSLCVYYLETLEHDIVVEE